MNSPVRGVGIDQASLDETVDYTAHHQQNGLCISAFQGVRWTSADGPNEIHRNTLYVTVFEYRRSEWSAGNGSP